MKKGILLFILAILFYSSVNALGSYSIYTDEDYLERNWSMVELATKVQTKFKKYYNIVDEYQDTYPEYYGGMYISDDAYNLIIQIVKNNIPDKGTDDYLIYDEIINMDSSIIVEYVTNSYNDLNKVNNYISDNLFTTENNSGLVTSSYLDIMNNAVNVELIDNSESQKDKVKSIVKKISKNQNDIIIFSDSKKHEVSKYIQSGGKILLESGSSSYCSMGMRVKYNGKNGYLTAGHCTTSRSSLPSGTVKVTQFANNEKYDYAFIETNSSYTPSNTLAYSTAGITTLGVINYCPSITVNMTISKAGAKTGYTSGKVTGLNKTINYTSPNITIKGMITSSVYQAKGDSGGVVMIPRTDSNGGAIGIGILSGGIDEYNEMYFSDINVLPIALQTRY